MKKVFLLLFTLHLSLLTTLAQDVTYSYNLSRISSYVKVGRIGEATFSAVKSSIDSLHQQYHSVDFVIDFLDAKGESGINAVMLADSLTTLGNRMAILVGQHTEGAGEQVAMFMTNAHKAVTIGAITQRGYAPNIQMEPNEKYLTQWYDSICKANIIEKTVARYLTQTDVKSLYPTGAKLLLNFNENAELIDILNEEAAKVGIKKNDNAFMYSGYVVVAQLRAELIKQVFPEDSDSYHKAQNIPVEQAIKSAQDTLESSEYRKLTAGE